MVLCTICKVKAITCSLKAKGNIMPPTVRLVFYFIYSIRCQYSNIISSVIIEDKMHTVEYACISCMDDIDLLKIGKGKKKICNECNKKFNHEVVHRRM